MTQSREKPRRVSTGRILYIVLCIVLILGMGGYLYLNEQKTTETRTESFSQIRTICELATLKCYFHNVAQYEKKADGIFSYGIFQYGHKKLWFEYSGIVKLGIDFNDVKVYPPDEQHVVKIVLPEAKVLSIDSDPDTFSDTLLETGVLITITGEDRTTAYSAAQQNMLEAAAENRSLLNQARERARKIIEEYIYNVGKKNGVNYRIQWVDGTEGNP